MRRILLVDDELTILRALRRCLLAGRPNDDNASLSIEMFTSAREAVDRMGDQEFDLVISDYRMPDMNGTTFLHCAAEINPSAQRLLMSAWADREAVINTIHTAGIVAFIAKPWDDAKLRATIDAVLSRA